MLATLLVALCTTQSAQAGGVPAPLPEHPGNVFVEGEELRIPLPDGDAAEAVRYQVLDDALGMVREGTLPDGSALELGVVPPGWYRVEFLDAEGACKGFTTAAVLPPLDAPVHGDSPVCLDVAMSWLAEEDPADWRRLSSLAALAGVNWVRDRIRWREVQTGPDTFVESTKYDEAARIQHAAGLNVLQVFHTVPEWARDPAMPGVERRGQPNLLHVYRFCRAMAKRFEGTVQAWEPWNEGNAGNFGGLTMDELCALQKAACLGFNDGVPDLTVCWAPLGGIDTERQAEAILRNETWPYYDIYSIHSYDWPHAYAELWEPARRAACGRPIWVTECDRGMKADPDSPVGDYTHAFARRKAEFVIQSYVCSLFAGSERHFHFILGPYMEGSGTVQFGLLRHDYTPRLSYVALAALGRRLAGARCLGRWEESGGNEMHVYAFRAVPGGVPADVLVAWTEKRADWPARGAAEKPWPLPDGLPVRAVYDYLGRPMDGVPVSSRSAPVFVELPPGAADALDLKTMTPAPYREGTRTPLVFQFDTPGLAPVIRSRAWTPEPERVVVPGSVVDCKLVLYNLSDEPVSGEVKAEALPEGCSLTMPAAKLRVEPMDRALLEFELHVPDQGVPDDAWLVFRGAFGGAVEPVLSVQLFNPE